MADQKRKGEPVDKSTSEEPVDESKEDDVNKEKADSKGDAPPLTREQKEVADKAFTAVQDAMGYFAEAYLKVMEEMGTTPDNALQMLGWALGKSPNYVASTKSKIAMQVQFARLFGKRDEGASILLSTAASMAIDAYMEHVKDLMSPDDDDGAEHLKKCKYCATRVKIEKEPEKKARFVAELWLSDGEDPGVVIQKMSHRLEMTQEQVADVFRSLSKEDAPTPPPVDVLEEMIKRHMSAEDKELLEELREHGHKVN